MKRNKWIASMLTVTMAGSMLAACSSGDGKEQAKPGAADAGKGVNPTGMPIVNTPLNLKFFTGKSPTNGNKFEDTLVWKEYAKMSNMNVIFELIPFENLTEKKNLVLAGGDYPDAFYSARLSAAELSKYGSQGVFVKLNDMIDKYAPNFKKLMDKYPDIRKGLTMPDGNIYSLPSFYDPSFLPMLIGTPLWVNKEWLDKLGMEEPKTTEEFYQYLKKVKDTDLNGNGQKDEIPYSSAGIGNLINQVKGAWGLGNRGLGHAYVDMDPASNKLRFTKTDPKYKEMLQYVNKLYAEGLLDKEIFTIKDSALYAKGQKGVLGSTVIPNPATLMNQKNYIGLGALKGPQGDQLYSHVKVPMVHVGAFAITNKNPNPEATLRWMDYFYSEEGAKFYFMGQKDVTYKEGAEGKMEYVDDITKNPQGLTQDQALAKYFTWLGGSYPGYVTEKWFKGSETLPEAIATGKKAQPNAVKEIWNNFNFTDAENEIMSSVGKDITSYVTEMEAKFVNGSASFDEWDKYVATVQKMGLDQYMKTYQAAYERYSKSK
ncbi:ABC transporter substrate-binding protein [Paenibacillus sp. NPDC056579]|uniref:ABC transporter substrate-binding protein n=1 Tax=Paenibacillus sp. NPDC056579 TaxID=3345871 RepID=UPI0036A7EED8